MLWTHRSLHIVITYIQLYNYRSFLCNYVLYSDYRIQLPAMIVWETQFFYKYAHYNIIYEEENINNIKHQLLRHTHIYISIEKALDTCMHAIHHRLQYYYWTRTRTFLKCSKNFHFIFIFFFFSLIVIYHLYNIFRMLLKFINYEKDEKLKKIY